MNEILFLVIFLSSFLKEKTVLDEAEGFSKLTRAHLKIKGFEIKLNLCAWLPTKPSAAPGSNDYPIATCLNGRNDIYMKLIMSVSLFLLMGI